jgi:hypothetical protein
MSSVPAPDSLVADDHSVLVGPHLGSPHPVANIVELFYASVTLTQNKLECWSLASIIFGIKARALNSGAENACRQQTLFNIAVLLSLSYMPVMLPQNKLECLSLASIFSLV